MGIVDLPIPRRRGTAWQCWSNEGLVVQPPPAARHVSPDPAYNFDDDDNNNNDNDAATPTPRRVVRLTLSQQKQQQQQEASPSQQDLPRRRLGYETTPSSLRQVQWKQPLAVEHEIPARDEASSQGNDGVASWSSTQMPRWIRKSLKTAKATTAADADDDDDDEQPTTATPATSSSPKTVVPPDATCNVANQPTATTTGSIDKGCMVPAASGVAHDAEQSSSTANVFDKVVHAFFQPNLSSPTTTTRNASPTQSNEVVPEREAELAPEPNTSDNDDPSSANTHDGDMVVSPHVLERLGPDARLAVGAVVALRWKNLSGTLWEARVVQTPKRRRRQQPAHDTMHTVEYVYDGSVQQVDLRFEEAYLFPLTGDNINNSDQPSSTTSCRQVSLERGAHIALHVGDGQYREATVTGARPSSDSTSPPARYRVHYHDTSSHAWISSLADKNIWRVPSLMDGSTASLSMEGEESSYSRRRSTSGRKRQRLD